MDNSEDAKIAALESELREIQSWFNHPIAAGLFKTMDDEAEALLELVLDAPVHSIESFFTREQSLGHLRGLRRAKAIVSEHVEELKDQLKQLQ